MLILYFFLVILSGALLSPPVYWGFALLGFDGSFHRLATSVMLAIAIAGLIPLMRARRLDGPENWGYGIQMRSGLRYIVLGIAFGLISMGLVVALEIAFGLQVWDDRRSFGHLVNAARIGLTTGLSIALVEESYFRGGLFSILRQSHGPRMVVASTAALYALSHLLNNDQDLKVVHWTSGMMLLHHAAKSLMDPAYYGVLITLVLAGILLAVLRVRLGHTYFGIGIHAGWVTIIQWAREAYNLQREHPMSWLVSTSLDHITGYLSALVILCFLAGTIMAIAFQMRESST